MLERITVATAAMLLFASTTLPAYAQSVPLEEGWACVTRVVDGDTVALDGYSNTVRFAGINAPELSTPLGPVARQTLAEWVNAAGCWVWVEPASPSFDRGTNRYSAHVWIEDPTYGWYLVQTELVRAGLAEADFGPYPPDQYTGELLAAQDAARAAGVGIWAAAAPPTAPAATPRAVAAPTAVPTVAALANCDSSYPDVCIPSPSPDLDCKDIPYRGFRVLPPDPHGFDRDRNGIGCES